MIDIEMIRHSLSHVLAEAVQKMFPGTKLGFGPAIDNGFYYDFEVPEKITPEHLKKIEKEMKKTLQNKKTEFIQSKMSIEEALKVFTEKG
ncbi:MAG: threonine--tRNA ligase, partial [Candidatus Muiribacteriota bacterium]